MSKRTREKNFWRKYGISNPKRVPETCSRFGSRLEDITDEDLDHFTQRVKKVDIMTLGENEVTNQGITYLARLESLRELDLKDLNVDDDCLPDLLKLHHLEWLNIRHTGISHEGVALLLEGLEQLKTLIFSWEPEEEHLVQALRQKYPDREIFGS